MITKSLFDMNNGVPKTFVVGWITDRGLPSRWYHRYYFPLTDAGVMRFHNIAREMKNISPRIVNVLYHKGARYDAIVVLKRVTNETCQVVKEEKQKGTRIVFDANVNYYKIWGDFPVPFTRPTEEQQRNAVWLAQASDLVVADSSYIAGVCAEFNQNVVHIPDNVDLTVFNGLRNHSKSDVVTLIWSGISQKAFHLSLIEETLAKFKDKIRLVLVSNNNLFPDVVTRLSRLLEVRYYPFEFKKYAALLLKSDILISPKILNNSYEMGHSEYKITLGMAQGLPVIASPQQSYKDALAHNLAGYLCDTQKDWETAFSALLNDVGLRQSMGSNGHKTVREHYGSPVVAKQYSDCLQKVLGAVRP